MSIAEHATIDHGYATTIHKSQEATVDRAFVLASDPMNRHLSYVAMTRHREEAALYGGQDEFAGLAELSALLSRSGAKKTTLDYEKADLRAVAQAAAEFSARRGIDGLAETFGASRARSRFRARPRRPRASRRVIGRTSSVRGTLAPRRRESPRTRPRGRPATIRFSSWRGRSSRATKARAPKGLGMIPGLATKLRGLPSVSRMLGRKGIPAPVDSAIYEAVAAAKEVWLTARAIDDARAAFEAERVRQAQIEARVQRLPRRRGKERRPKHCKSSNRSASAREVCKESARRRGALVLAAVGGFAMIGRQQRAEIASAREELAGLQDRVQAVAATVAEMEKKGHELAAPRACGSRPPNARKTRKAGTASVSRSPRRRRRSSPRTEPGSIACLKGFETIWACAKAKVFLGR